MMADIGFLHPDLGYWQAVDPVLSDADLLATYPAGTIEVPLKPGADHEWQGGQWVYVAPPTPPVAVPATISRRQLLIGLATEGYITAPEAVAAATTGALPTILQKVISTMSATNQVGAQITWASMSDAERTNPLLLAAAQSIGKTQADIDALFIKYGSI
jgi:hypothetical protein